MLMNANSNKLARIAINKSCLKEYSTSLSERTVYLNNGSEFQIQLFNPHNYKIACRISIDGKEFPNQIMLKPGQRIWLERYIDIAKKFKFSTYEVEANNKQVDSAIRDNGVVSIKFYAEDRNCASIIKYVTDSPIIRDTIYDCFTTDTVKLNNCVSNSLSSNINALYNNSSITNSNYSISQELGINTAVSTTAVNKSVKETGRVEEGSYSNQSLNYSYGDRFLSYPFAIETIKILPMSEKTYTAGDLKKIYCHNCGRKLKTKYKFCPFCGTKIC